MKRYTYVKYKISNIINVQKIVTIHYLNHVKNFSTMRDCHNFWEFVFVDANCAEINADGNVFLLNNGEIFFHHPNQNHSLKIGEIPSTVFIMSFVCTNNIMNFFINKRKKLTTEQKKYLSLIIREAEDSFVLEHKELLLKNIRLNSDAPVGASQYIRIYSELLLLSLLRAEVSSSSKKKEAVILPSRDSMKDRIVCDIISFMENNIKANLSVDDICRYAKYSRTYISKIFKELTGLSLIEYYNKARIDRAKKLLNEGKYSVTQISEMLGFASVHYFSRTFKRIIGNSPTQYAETLRHNLDEMEY